MTIHVFVGPTLSSAEVLSRLPAAVVHPPIAHGDPFRLLAKPGDVVAVIDGLFFQSTSVRHKELLWLLTQGVRVVGASSMGALRAAELDRFGMRGVGQVYRAFADGQLVADDEVAVAHADVDDDWLQHSDALANLRTAAARASAEGVLTRREATAFVEAARSLYFPQRRASQVIRLCTAAGTLSAATADAFTAWLRTSPWDAKAEDARLLLDDLARDAPSVRAPDDEDWPIGDLPGFVHDWIRDHSPIDETGTTGAEVEALLKLYASDAADVITRMGASAAARAWDLASATALAEQCEVLGLTEPADQLERLVEDYLRPEERNRAAPAAQTACALARSAFASAGQAEPRPTYPASAIELAASVAAHNATLARAAAHHRPEFIAATTVDRHFARWWNTENLALEARRRGFRDLDDFRAAARRSLAFVAAHGVPALTWESA